ncbi:DUF2867 domain-containing protein [Acidimicrobiaceae bacterium AH-315-P05]|nr:DUF2867 domain-containing protein [Acidimicrobiaceae bacterium AH-315-P05]
MPEPKLAISVEGVPIADVDADQFDELDVRDFKADFHCVTTWSVTDLTWTGVPLREVLESVGIDSPPATFLLAKAHDGGRGHFLTIDALREDVIVATHLNGKPLGDRHGGPLRLVAPRLYAYKSIKHLAAIDFRAKPPTRLGKAHLRGRVALEERHPKVPGRLLRFPNRLLIPPTAYLAERSLAKQQRERLGPNGTLVSQAAPATGAIVTSIYDSPDYLDRFVKDVAPGTFDSVDDVATAWFTEQPTWLRIVSTNTLTRRALQDAIATGGYRIGTSVGAWEIIDRDDDEIVFGDDMGFMQYRFSLRLSASAAQIEAATAVKYLWPRAGRYYFAIVRPIHTRFVKVMLRKSAATYIDS